MKNLIFKSQIPYKNVKKEIHKMDILLMPYTDKVTSAGDVSNIIKFMSPMKMFDYLASSKVIIASKLPVYTHILKSGYNSILVEPENIKGWIKNIENVFLNKKLRNKLKINAYNTAKKYTWDKRVSKILKWYQVL